ncbi:alpha/beta hydrolase [Rhodococcus sp. Chr-9]|nr:alpha/beta hydrolase [Rhodococcus sp. Chr-9]
MNDDTEPTVIIVPGLRDHVADHWQTLLADRLDRVRTVPPLDHDRLSLDARIAALDAVVSDVDGPIVLVAHSAGVLITAHWAHTSNRPVLGATPADVEKPLPEGYPTIDDLDRGGWLPIPRRRLPFPSILAASSNDPLADRRRVAGLAEAWGSRFVDLGAVGHLNPASGFGDWPAADVLLRELLGRPAAAQSEITSVPSEL